MHDSEAGTVKLFNMEHSPAWSPQDSECDRYCGDLTARELEAFYSGFLSEGYAAIPGLNRDTAGQWRFSNGWNLAQLADCTVCSSRLVASRAGMRRERAFVADRPAKARKARSACLVFPRRSA